MSRWGTTSAVVAIGLSAASCVNVRPEAPLSPCDVITGQATNYGQAATLRLAERNFRILAPDIRGGLTSTGVRRVRVIGQRRFCEPYRVFGTATGLVTCKVQARVCGRS